MADVVTVTGAGRLARTLRSADRGLRDMSEPNRSAAQLLASQAAGRAPRRTGRLAGSIRPGGVTTTESVVTVSVPYGLPVEFGTRRMTARPYALPAAADVWPRIVPLYQARIDQQLSTVKGA